MSDNDSIVQLEKITKLADREEAYFELVRLFKQETDEFRELVRECWDFGVEWIYPNVKRLACKINERYLPIEKIQASLIYDSIEDLRQEDVKDKLVALAVIYHSCIAAGIDPQKQFEEVALISSPKIANLFRGFINRSDENKSMEAFLLVAVQNSDGETEIYPSWMNL